MPGNREDAQFVNGAVDYIGETIKAASRRSIDNPDPSGEI
jgi:hypothetical protein